MTEFLEQSAQIVSNVFGQNIGLKANVDRWQGPSTRSTPKFSHVSRGQKVKSLTTTSNLPTSSGWSRSGSGVHRYCILCHGNRHDLSFCSQFKKYTLDRRVTFVRENRLCNNCLIPNHFAKGCVIAPKCTFDGCHKKHNTLLHFGNAKLSYNRAKGSGSIEPQRDIESGDVTGAGVRNTVKHNQVKTSTSCHATMSQVCFRAVPVMDNGART